MNKIGIILWCLACILALTLGVKGCVDNIRQDQQDSILLNHINQRTKMILEHQKKLCEIDRHLKELEEKLATHITGEK